MSQISVSANGTRRRAARIEVVSPVAGVSETTAIVAALEQFLADTAAPPARPEPPSRWQRAALEVGVGAHQLDARGWGIRGSIR